MFEKLSYTQKAMVYEGLFKLVNSNSGIGFGNDQGHPAYRVGARNVIDHKQFGDSPEANKLFVMMHELSVSLNEHEGDRPTNVEYVFCWADFCRIAVDAYNVNKK